MIETICKCGKIWYRYNFESADVCEHIPQPTPPPRYTEQQIIDANERAWEANRY